MHYVMFTLLILMTALPMTPEGSSSSFHNVYSPSKEEALKADLDSVVEEYNEGGHFPLVSVRSLVEKRTDERSQEQPNQPKTPESPSLPGNPYTLLTGSQLPDRLSTPQTPIGDRNTNPAALGLEVWMQNEFPKQLTAKEEHRKASKAGLDAFREGKEIAKKLKGANPRRDTTNPMEASDRLSLTLERDRKLQTHKKAQWEANKADRAFKNSRKNIMSLALSSKSMWNHMKTVAPQHPNNAWPIGHPFRNPRQEGLHLFAKNEGSKKVSEQRMRQLFEAESRGWKTFDALANQYGAPMELTLEQEKEWNLKHKSELQAASRKLHTAYGKALAAQTAVENAQMVPWQARQTRLSIARMWATVPSIGKSLKKSDQAKRKKQVKRSSMKRVSGEYDLNGMSSRLSRSGSLPALGSLSRSKSLPIVGSPRGVKAQVRAKTTGAAESPPHTKGVSPVRSPLGFSPLRPESSLLPESSTTLSLANSLAQSQSPPSPKTSKQPKSLIQAERHRPQKSAKTLAKAASGKSFRKLLSCLGAACSKPKTRDS